MVSLSTTSAITSCGKWTSFVPLTFGSRAAERTEAIRKCFYFTFKIKLTCVLLVTDLTTCKDTCRHIHIRYYLDMLGKSWQKNKDWCDTYYSSILRGSLLLLLLWQVQSKLLLLLTRTWYRCLSWHQWVLPGSVRATRGRNQSSKTLV